MQDGSGPWMEAARELLPWLAERRVTLVTAVGASGAEILGHGAGRSGLRHLCLLQPADQRSVAGPAWDRFLQFLDRNRVATGWAIPAWPAAEPLPRVGDAAGTPERDRAAVAWGDEVVVLRLRWGGNLHGLLRHRLDQGVRGVYLAHLPELQSRRARQELLDRGAEPLPGVGLRPQGRKAIRAHAVAERGFGPPGSQTPDVAPLPSPGERLYLAHATRACSGPWPGESREDYLDQLWAGSEAADHSAFATLARILRQRRLIASSRAIRGGHAVVSFSAVPLDQLPELRVFRSHRGRWDFEPFGICISRQWLRRRGARPVRYGTAEDWPRLPESERPFFQLNRAGSGRPQEEALDRSAIDWSVEREWRHLGDLDLSDLHPDQGLVFVPTLEHVAALSGLAPWPITLLGPHNR